MRLPQTASSRSRGAAAATRSPSYDDEESPCGSPTILPLNMPPGLLCQILTPPQPVWSDCKLPYDIAVEYHMDGLSNLRTQADGSRHYLLQANACASETLKVHSANVRSCRGHGAEEAYVRS